MDLEQWNNAVQGHLGLGKDINLMASTNYLCVEKTTIAILVNPLNTVSEWVSWSIDNRQLAC
jgi:hypothetical protein